MGWLAVAPGCNGDVVVDTGPGGGGNGGNAGFSGSSGDAGFGGYGGDVSPVGGYGGDLGGYGGDIVGPPVSCNEYCMTINSNCTGDRAQYSDDNSCAGICAHFEPGYAGQTSGDTLGCRAYHASEPSKQDPVTHCPHAGPLGGFVCSASDCSAFCALAMAVCGGQAQPPYPDEGTCEMYCATYVDTTKVPYNATVTSGDSLACRMYHLTVAASGPDVAQIHCPHVGPKSDPCQ